MSEAPEQPPAPEPTTSSEQPTPTPTEPTESLSLVGQEPSATPQEEAPAAEPVAFDALTLPEGVTVNEDFSSRFTEALNGEMTGQERAQALLDLHLEAQRQGQEAASQAWVDQQSSWQSEVRNAEDIGGAHFDATIDRVNRLVGEYGTPELNEVLATTGAGNNVHVIRFLNNLAKQHTEGAPLGGSPAGTSQTAAQRMFPSMKG